MARAGTSSRRLFLYDWDNTLFPSFVYKAPPEGLWVGQVGKQQPYLTSNDSIAMFSNLVDVSHLNEKGMFLGQSVRAMLSLNAEQPSSVAAREARHRAAVSAFKLLDASIRAGGDIILVTAGTAEWLEESFQLYNDALEGTVLPEVAAGGAGGGCSSNASTRANTPRYTLVLPDTVPLGGNSNIVSSGSSAGHSSTCDDGGGPGDSGVKSVTIPGYSTVFHVQDKESIFRKLAAANGVSELVVVGDGEEEMTAARTLAVELNGKVAVTTIDLRDKRPINLDGFVSNLEWATDAVKGLAP